MSTIGGSFDETILLNQRVKADEIMFDDRIKQQFTPQFEILNAIRAAQTARVETPVTRRKDADVQVIWENFCDITADDCSSSCTLGGNKSSTNAQIYELSFCKEVGFTMDELDFLDNEFEINVAKAFLKADKELTESFAQYAVAQLEAFKGENMLTTGKGTYSGGDTYIEAAYWTPAIAAYFSRVSIMNRFTNPIFLSGSLLWEQFMVAKANSANADGKGDWALWAGMQPYFDMFNIDSVNDPALKAYLLSMGSVAMVNKYYNPTVPERLMDYIRYTMPARWMPGFVYDVFYDNSCTTNKHAVHNYTVRLKADIYNNPEGCETGNTGVLAFQCGAPLN